MNDSSDRANPINAPDPVALLGEEVYAMVREVRAMQAEYQSSRAELFIIQAENSRILDRLEHGREGQE